MRRSLLYKLPYIFCNLDKLSSIAYKLQNPYKNIFKNNFIFGSYLGRIHKLTSHYNYPCYTFGNLIHVNNNKIRDYILNQNSNPNNTLDQSKSISFGFIAGFFSDDIQNLNSTYQHDFIIRFMNDIDNSYNIIKTINTNDINDIDNIITNRIQLFEKINELWKDYELSKNYKLWCKPMYNILDNNEFSSHDLWNIIMTIYLKNIEYHYIFQTPLIDRNMDTTYEHIIKLDKNIYKSNLWYNDLEQWRNFHNISKDANSLKCKLPIYKPIDNIINLTSHNKMLDARDWTNIYGEIKRANKKFVSDVSRSFTEL